MNTNKHEFLSKQNVGSPDFLRGHRSSSLFVSISVNSWLALGILASIIFLTGCHSPQEQSTPLLPAKIESNRVIFAENTVELASLSIEPIEVESNATLRLNGRLVWDDNVTVKIFTPFAGRVTRIQVEPGQAVKQGDPLVLIASPDYGQAQSDARKAAADYRLTERNFSRVRELFEHGAAPQKDLQSAEADFARASSEKQRAEARLALYGARADYGGSSDSIDQVYTLKSPLDGTVVEKNVNPGQEVRPDQMLANAPQFFSPLFVVTDPKRIWLFLDVNEYQLSDVQLGQQVLLRTAAYPDQEFHAKIELISDSVDPNTRTVKVRAGVDNSARLLKAEMLVRAEVDVPHTSGINVTSSAVFLRGDKHYVFVQEGPGTFCRREVKVGRERAGKLSVLEGVKPGQRIVTGNCLLLEQLLNSAGG